MKIKNIKNKLNNDNNLNSSAKNLLLKRNVVKHNINIKLIKSNNIIFIK